MIFLFRRLYQILFRRFVFFVFAEKTCGGKFRKPFVLPCLLRLIAPHGGVPPLVRRFVRDDIIAFAFRQRIGNKTQRGILHSSLKKSRFRKRICSIRIFPVCFGIITQRLFGRLQRFLRQRIFYVIIFYGNIVFPDPHRRFRFMKRLRKAEREIARVLQTITAGSLLSGRRSFGFFARRRRAETFRKSERDEKIGAIRNKRIAVGIIHVFVKSPVLVPIADARYAAQNREKISEIHRRFAYAEAVIDKRQRCRKRNFYAYAFVLA